MSLIRFYIVSFLMFFGAIVGYSQPPVTFNVGSATGVMGETVCIDITVEDFVNVSSAQWVLSWDPDVAELICPIDVSDSDINLIGSSITIGNFGDCASNSADGFLNLVWFDLATTGVTLQDGDLFFTACFLLVGEPCDETPVCIRGSGQIEMEVIQVGPNEEEIEQFPNLGKGNLTIDPEGYAVSANFCSSDDNSDTGSITFAPSGGVPPYSWELTPTGQMGSVVDDCEPTTIPNLAPGNYTIVTTDADNTIRTTSITIEANSDFPYVVELTGVDPTCFDKNNGVVTVDNITGGEGPFTYEWSTFEFLDGEIEKLPAGDYSVTVSDVNGCTTTAEYTLTADTIKLELDNFTNPSCPNSQDGVVTITATGGTPFGGGDYNWEIDGKDNPFFGFAGPTNPFTANNLPEGTFTVVASDNASSPCQSDPICFTLESGSFADLTIDLTDTLCFGECDGEVLINVGNGGNFGFMVNGPTGPVNGNITTTTFDVDDLCPGMYDVRITDSVNGCIKDTFFTIIESSELNIVVQDTMGPGCGGGDGFANIDAVGGTMTFSFEWQDGFMMSDRVNMTGGTYSVTVTDNTGCRDALTFTFSDGGDIGLNAFVSDAISCAGASDGSVSATVTATEMFTFTWEDENGASVGNGDIIENLPSGFYYVTATDGMCTDTDTVFLVDGQKPSVTVMQNDPSCPDSDDGMLTAFPDGGTTPFMYSWTEPPSTAELSSGAVLFDGVGTYNLNIIDAQGCETDTLLMISPPANQIMVDVTNIVGTPCFGECLGSATLSASGGPAGTGNYTYFISNVSNPASGGASINFNELCPGQQWVVAVDGLCASDTIFFDVPDGEELIITGQSTINPPSCAGGDDGEITLVLSGGNPANYDIFWVDQNINGPTITGLVAGTYTAEITDGNNCVFTESFDLVTPDPLSVAINPSTTIEIGCFSSTSGRIGLEVTGGNDGDLSYNWNPAVSNTDFAENLGPGLYEVTVTDSRGCVDSTSYTLTSSEPIVAVIDAPDQPDCFGGTTCLGIESVSGGSGSNYTFTISNGGFPFSVDTCVNVFADTYTITVFDGNGCSTQETITISQPTEVLVDAGPDVTINLGEETEPISTFIVSELDIDSIIWTPMIDIECNTNDCQVVTFSPDATTSYTVTVIDENGCMVSDNISVFVDLTRNAYLSNIFSPNGDNRNDLFQVVTGFGVQEVLQFRIFDRWGNMVFVDENFMPDDSLHPGWDGTYNGSDSLPGVYVYYAEVLFEDGVRVQYKGDVTLVR